MKIIFSCLVTYALLFNAPAYAIDITLGEQQINQLVKLQFPQKQLYQGLEITTTNPAVRLQGSDQSVLFKAQVIVSDGSNTMLANVSGKSAAIYNNTSNTIEVSDAEITQFDVIENTLFTSEEALANFEQVLRDQVPIAVLIDYDKVKLGGFKLAPKNMRIVDGGLRLTF